MSASAVDFDRATRHYYISSAEHALQYAPLPEFQDALSVLKAYDASSTDENYRALKEAHKGLRRQRYTYTAFDQYRFALVSVIHNVLAGLHSVNLSGVIHFAEAACLATRAASPWKEASKNADAVLRREADYHWDLWERCFS